MLATWCKELTHWERSKAGGEGNNRGWDGWMASPTQCTWVWVDSGSWWWTGRPGMLRFMGSQRAGHNWATELNWIWVDYCCHFASNKAIPDQDKDGTRAEFCKESILLHWKRGQRSSSSSTGLGLWLTQVMSHWKGCQGSLNNPLPKKSLKQGSQLP